MKILEKSFKLSYIICFILFIDSRFTNPIFGWYKYYAWMFVIIWGILLICINGNKGLIISKKNKAFPIIAFLILYFSIFGILSLFSLMEEYSKIELLNWLQFILVLIICVYWFDKLKIEFFFIYATYIISAGLICIAFFYNGAPLEVLTRINKVFSSIDRYRLTFGYYHVNGLGSLCSFSIIFSVMLLSIILQKNRYSKLKKIINITMILVLDIIVFIVLLSTASRSSIMILGIFAITVAYYLLIYARGVSNKIRFLLSILLVVIGIIIIGFGLWDQIVLLFVDSNRLNNFMINLPLLRENGKLLTGLGLVDPGLFGTKMTIYGKSYYVDNYYLYIIVETGILGTVAIFLILRKLGVELHRSLKANPTFLSIAIYACFIAQIFSGMAETSVFYYIFPSCLGYWSLYMLEINKSLEERIKKC